MTVGQGRGDAQDARQVRSESGILYTAVIAISINERLLWPTSRLTFGLRASTKPGAIQLKQ